VIRLSATGRPVDVVVVPMLPAGASAARVTLDGVARETTEQPGPPGAQRRGLVVNVGAAPRTVEITWRGGLAVEPPVAALTPGQESQGLRVLDFRPAGEGWVLDLEGTPGRGYVVAVHGAPVRAVVASGGASVSFAGRDGARAAFDVRFPAGVGREVASVRFTPAELESPR
jgi:hypothetical protein